MPLRILVIGSGAREHALLWKLAQSDQSVVLYAAPGNPGTAMLARNVELNALDTEGLAAFARREKIDLTIVGPDQSLATGIVDVFHRHGLRIFGPTRQAATIETSKSAAKRLMKTAEIPTAEYWTCRRLHVALNLVRVLNRPLFVKADGLAQGKGVYRCLTVADAEQAIHRLMVAKEHGVAGDEIVIEEWLEGHEFSLHAICSPHHAVLFPISQDYKRLTSDPASPNTGGMGAIAPIPGLDEQINYTLASKLIRPLLRLLQADGQPFTGCLYPGIMVTTTGPKVIEYNARFGDPETQVYMRLLDTNLVQLIMSAVDDRLGPVKANWSPQYAANVVLAAEGYPYRRGISVPITGLEQAESIPGVVIFHAGTMVDGKQLLATSGRVLSVTATADTLAEAAHRCYRAISFIHFRGMQYRDDIGHHWLQQET